jgi:hypothetical protein
MMFEQNDLRYQICIYEIRLKGYFLSGFWEQCFFSMQIEADEARGETILRGEIADQAALFGILNRIRDTGLELISVNRYS